MQQEIPNLSEDERIGKGTFGEVFKTKFKGQLCAIKKLSLRELHRAQMSKQVQKQISIMKSLDCPNIVRCMAAMADSHNQYQYLVMELCDCNLNEFMNQNIEAFMSDQKLKIKISLQFINALIYMKRRRVANRDIKIQNIMIKKIGPTLHDIIIKITDFGEARQYINATSTRWRVGSYKYMSPEVYLNQNYDDTCDLWSAGVVLYQIFQGFDPNSQSKELLWPFLGICPQSVHNSWEQNETFNSTFYTHYIRQPLLLLSNIPSSFKKIIKGFLKIEPSSRITVEQIIQIFKESDQTEIFQYFSENEIEQFKKNFKEWQKYNADLQNERMIEKQIKSEIIQIFQNIVKKLSQTFEKLKKAYRVNDKEFLRLNNFSEAAIFYCRACDRIEEKLEDLKRRHNWRTQDIQSLFQTVNLKAYQESCQKYLRSLSQMRISRHHKLNVEAIKQFLQTNANLNERTILRTAEMYFQEFQGKHSKIFRAQTM